MCIQIGTSEIQFEFKAKLDGIELQYFICCIRTYSRTHWKRMIEFHDLNQNHDFYLYILKAIDLGNSPNHCFK